MEEMTVVSFFVDREAIAWKEGWEFSVQEMVYQNEDHGVKYIRVGLPFWEREDTLWTAMGQKEYLGRLPIPQEGRRVCHMCDSESEILFGKRPENLSIEWGFFLLDFYRPRFEGVVIFEDRHMDVQELALHFAPFMPYVGVVTANPWRLEEVSEYILEEYGYQIEMASTFARLHPRRGRLLLWAGREKRGLSPLSIPSNSIWLDVCCENSRNDYALAIRKKKVKYMNLFCFLQDFEWKSCKTIEKNV